MTRDQIAQTSYDAADLLSRVRLDVGHITQEEYDEITSRSKEARALLSEVEAATKIQSSEDRKAALDALRGRGMELMESTICQKENWNGTARVYSAVRPG